MGPGLNAGLIERLIRAGMDVARLNLSHGTPEEHAGYIRIVRELAAKLGRNVAILIDLPGQHRTRHSIFIIIGRRYHTWQRPWR